MRCKQFLLVALCAIASLPAVRASAAVDPGVSDRGPNSASLRDLGKGNGQFSLRRDITRRVPWQAAQRNQIDPQTGLPLPQPFEIRIPGVRAYVQQPNYLVPSPGGYLSPNLPPRRSHYLQLPGPNTVYSLIPPSPNHVKSANQNPHWHDNRFSTRFDTRVGKAFTTQFSTQLHSRIHGESIANARSDNLPAGTYVPGNAVKVPQPDAAMKQLLKRLNPSRSEQTHQPPATQPTSAAPATGHDSRAGTHRAGEVPESIKRELHVVDQPHRAETHSDQRDHTAGQ